MAARAVDDQPDFAVRDEVEIAVEVAQAHVAQRDLLNGAAPAGDVDHVAVPDLVLEQQEKAGEVVLDQALGAEADGNAGDARGGEDRQHRDAQLAEHQGAGDDADERRGHASQHPVDGADAPGIVGVTVRHVAVERGDEARRDPLQQPGERQDQHDARRLQRRDLGIVEIEQRLQLPHAAPTSPGLSRAAQGRCRLCRCRRRW